MLDSICMMFVAEENNSFKVGFKPLSSIIFAPNDGIWSKQLSFSTFSKKCFDRGCFLESYEFSGSCGAVRCGNLTFWFESKPQSTAMSTVASYLNSKHSCIIDIFDHLF